MHQSHSPPAQPVIRPGKEAEKVRPRMETEQRWALLKILHFIWLGFGILDGLIVLRIMLKVVADDPQHPLARLIYEVTGPFLAPFAVLTPPLAADGLALEIHSIFAVFAYPLISVLVERLIWNLSSRPKIRPGRGKLIMRTRAGKQIQAVLVRSEDALRQSNDLLARNAAQATVHV